MSEHAAKTHVLRDIATGSLLMAPAAPGDPDSGSSIAKFPSKGAALDYAALLVGGPYEAEEQWPA